MNTKYFQTGGFTITVNADMPFKDDTFHPKFRPFKAAGPGRENIVVNHFFKKPPAETAPGGKRLYYKKPWAIYDQGDRILYKWMATELPGSTFLRKMIANKDHTRLDIFHDDLLAGQFKKGGLQDITLLPTDQILLSRVLGFHKGCLIHSLGLIFKGNGFLFVGHSGAGKTTIARMMMPESTILCDDRNIIRERQDAFQLHGTWKYSELEEISPETAPLRGIFFIRQADDNKIVPIADSKTRFYLIMDHLVKSLVTPDWMEATLDVVEKISKQINCYYMYFNQTGQVKKLINQLCSEGG
ncbi:MAG: hypothetical protein MI862_04130 [Desulfobacterales bacterium]|nr:hypothetical protein [Desulfobacterales bacterium]